MTGIASRALSHAICGGAAESEALVDAIETSPIMVPEPSALGQVRPGRLASSDVDGEVLRWIASHVKSKKRLGGPLMTIAALLVGASIGPVAFSLAALFDLVA